MKRVIRTACAAGLLAVTMSSASAQNVWVGMMEITKDTSGSGCGDEPGNMNKIYYRPHINGGDPPSGMVILMGDAIVYLQNKDLTAQFQGKGQLTAAGTLHRRVQNFQKARGSYNIVADPAVVDANTQTIKVSSGKVTVKVDVNGDAVLDSCVFQFRAILTPEPAGGS